MKTNKHQRKAYVILLLIIIVCNCLMLLIFAEKKAFHIDEVWSYSLSNSHEKPFLYYWQVGTGEIGSETRNYKPENGEENPFYNDKDNRFYEQWHSGGEFHDYLTVQENERFDYSNVYYNQTCDVHPPLYYFLLHTVCSFFPDGFSKWYAAVINLFFYSLSLIALFFLGRQVFGSDKKALLAAAVWGLSRAGLSNAAFLRMYMMMAFFTILLAYFHMRLIENYRIKYVALIFAVNLAGFLTQYYFYIFSFFITASVCVYLLFKKRIKQLLIYAFTVLASVGAAILVFPATLVHLTQGVYTNRTVNGLLSLFDRSNMLTYLLQDYTGLAYHEKTLLVDLLPLIAAAAVLILWLKVCKEKTDKKKKIASVIGRFRADYTVLLVSLILAGVVVGRIAPYKPYFNDRYVFALLPLFALPFVSAVCFLAKKAASLFKKEKYDFKAAAAVLMIFAVLSNTLNENRYFGRSRNLSETDNILAEAADGGTFYYVAEREYMIHTFSVMFGNSDKVYPAHEFDDSLVKRINDNEVNAEAAYIIFEAAGNEENDYNKSSFINGVNYILSEGLDYNFEFVTDFYFGNDIFGDFYYLYKVCYTDPF